MVPAFLVRRQVGLAAVFAGALAGAARADWQTDATSISWKNGAKVVWRFSFDKNKGKPFFDPVSVAGGPALTNFKPADHPWHYGLWFSWKYINHVNYWEENKDTGDAEGITTWRKPEIATQPDGSAAIKMDVIYANPKGIVDLTETRAIEISAPTADGSYALDWRATFTAGKEGAILDRTPMPGEPQGVVNGGYAGLSVRMAAQPLTMNVMTPGGPVVEFPSSRARPATPAVGCNFIDNGKDVGGIAFFGDPANPGGANAPWYLINDNTTNNGEGFRFMCSAVLAPKVLTLKATEKMELHYRIGLSPRAWTAQSLKATLEQWFQTTSAQ
jgi:hypothetical protein